MTIGDILVLPLLIPCAVFVAMGIPLSMGKVPPNRLYGFRTRKTLQDPVVWNPTNRVAGYWMIATGFAAAAVTITTFFTGLGLPAGPLVILVPFVVGMVVAYIHCLAVIRRLTTDKQKAILDL